MRFKHERPKLLILGLLIGALMLGPGVRPARAQGANCALLASQAASALVSVIAQTWQAY